MASPRNENPQEWSDIITNLKTVAKIRKHDKLQVRGKLLCIDDTYTRCISRWWLGTNRQSCIEFFHVLLDNCGQFIETARIGDDRRKRKEVCLAILHELSNSLVGIENLKTTYKLDMTMVSQLEVVISKVHSHIGRLGNVIFSDCGIIGHSRPPNATQAYVKRDSHE